MHRIIKPGGFAESGKVVQIPDAAPPPPPPEETFDFLSDEQGGEGIPRQLYDSVMQKAQEDADSFTEKVRRLAQVERDGIIKKANEEAEKLKKRAYQEALAAAVEGRQTEIDACLKTTRDTLAALRVEHQDYMKLYELELREFALDIASSIMQKRISEYGADISDMIKHAVNSVKDADWITVEISGRLPQLLVVLQKELEDGNGRGKIEIVAKDMAADSCLIRTPDGTIDASVTTQLENLREYFKQVD